MRWTWTVPILVLVIALTGGRSIHLVLWPEHDAAEHSHGHWHGDVYHVHHHDHDEAGDESLDDHAAQPHDHDHGLTNAPGDDNNSISLMATPARRDQWK